MTTLLRMVAHLPPAFSRCSEEEDRRELRFGFALLAAIPATAALTLLMLGAI